jgi:hypothetical protein
VVGAVLEQQMSLPFDLLTLGSGKRLFADGTLPAACKVTKSQVSPTTGIIVVNHARAGAVATGSL